MPRDEVILYPSRTKTVLLTVLALGFVVFGLWLIQYGAVRDDLIAGIFGTLAVVFFGACTMSALARLLLPRPALIIDDDGITDEASAVAVGFIAKDEIGRVAEYVYSGQRFLGITPSDIDAVLARVSAFKRFAIRANLRLGAAPINIPQAILTQPVDELAREIRVRYSLADEDPGHR